MNFHVQHSGRFFSVYRAWALFALKLRPAYLVTGEQSLLVAANLASEVRFFVALARKSLSERGCWARLFFQGVALVALLPVSTQSGQLIHHFLSLPVF